MSEWMGWVATLIFTVSYFFRDPKILRWIQALAALLWLAYGVSIHARPVIVANIIVATAAVYSSFRKSKETAVAPRSRMR
jgi:hypothetical protein